MSNELKIELVNISAEQLQFILGNFSSHISEIKFQGEFVSPRIFNFADTTTKSDVFIEKMNAARDTSRSVVVPYNPEDFATVRVGSAGIAPGTTIDNPVPGTLPDEVSLSEIVEALTAPAPGNVSVVSPTEDLIALDDLGDNYDPEDNKVTPSSGNVFDDLDVPTPDEPKEVLVVDAPKEPSLEIDEDMWGDF